MLILICRTICEVAATPETGSGLFGDFFDLLLVPQEDLEALTEGVRLLVSGCGARLGRFYRK